MTYRAYGISVRLFESLQWLTDDDKDFLHSDSDPISTLREQPLRALNIGETLLLDQVPWKRRTCRLPPISVPFLWVWCRTS